MKPWLKRTNYTITPPEIRFWQKVQKTDSCWLWTGTVRADGYGGFFNGTKMTVAHKWAYLHWVGPVPDGLQLDHLCRVRNCVNPDHLEAVTVRDNLLRGVGFSAVNARKTECPRGHPYNEVNTRVDKNNMKHCRPCQREMYHERKARACHASA